MFTLKKRDYIVVDNFNCTDNDQITFILHSRGSMKTHTYTVYTYIGKEKEVIA